MRILPDLKKAQAKDRVCFTISELNVQFQISVMYKEVLGCFLLQMRKLVVEFAIRVCKITIVQGDIIEE